MPSPTGSSATAFVTPTTTGWGAAPLLTLGDKPDGSTYPMVGKPDGLGALAGRVGADGTVTDTARHVTVFMDHELPADRGVVRAHGTRGSFVSQWTVDRDTLRIVDGGTNYGGGPAPLEHKGAIDGTFVLVDVTDAARDTGAALQAVSVQRGITGFSRPEDGHWDTQDPNSLYWVATGGVPGGQQQPARLYRLKFDSVTQPTGGSIQLVVDSSTLIGKDGVKAGSFDNVTVNGSGDVVIQEDQPGADISRIWLVTPGTGTATQILEADRARFLAGGANFLTTDEEHSGVIEVTSLFTGANWYQAGRRYYLGTTQAHTGRGPELVEDGQLYLFGSPP